VAPLGRRTHSERETLEVKLAIHFPNSVVSEEIATTVDAGCAKCCDWWVATRDVTHRRVEWAIDSFAPYKRPGTDGIFTALL
jgi:hypothetical protein